jgi:uncharacterized membrane protein
MAFCASCGTAVAGQYCPKCGAPAPGAGGAPSAAGGLAENAACALCYLFGFITGILFLVLAPYNQNKTVRFHAFQSIFLHVAFIVFWIVAGMILPWSVSLILSPLIGLGGLVLWILMMWKAYQNQKVKLPFIGDLAEKQA